MPIDLDVAARAAVIAAYSTTSACKCCHMATAAYLNVIQIRLGPDNKQVLRMSDGPTRPEMWAYYQRIQFPEGFVIYCSNCIASHEFDGCPYQAADTNTTG